MNSTKLVQAKLILINCVRIPLWAKQVGEFIKNGHNKISPTCIESGSGVTLWLCNSVYDKRSIISGPYYPFEPKEICFQLGKKYVAKFFFSGKGWLGQGITKTVICQAISVIWQDIGLKIET